MAVETLTRIPQTGKNFDPQEARKLGGSLEGKIGHGYNVLSEIDILLKALEREAEIDQDSHDYVLENEFAAACEAIDSGRYFWSSYRPWDPNNKEFLAFGVSFRRMLHAGIDDMRKQIQESQHPEFNFELERREAELGTEEGLTTLYPLGELSNEVLLTISPYPEEVSSEVASSLGYKAKEQIAKLRFEVFINNVRQTIELSVANGSLGLFQDLIAEQGYDPSLYSHTTSFLNRPIQLGDSSNYLDVIINLVKRYDSLLENQAGIYYFCGQPVESSQGKNYESIVDSQRWIRKEGKPLIEWMYQVDLELARSLHAKNPNKYVTESAQYWISAKDANGNHLLPFSERLVLSTALNSGPMSREVAFILKKNELVRMWSVMACLVNEERAKKIFNADQVRYFRDLARTSHVWHGRVQSRLDQMIAQADFEYLICGGLILPFGLEDPHNFFLMPLEQVKKSLFGEKDILCCTCPFCKEEVKAEIENKTITCPKCGKNAPYTKQRM